MRTYEQAMSLVGSTLAASVTNGKTKRLRFECRGDTVRAVLFETPIVTFHPDHVELRTGGWVTPTTFDGMAAALGEQRYGIGTTKRVAYYRGTPMSEGMWLSYAGDLMREGSEPTPMSERRR